MVRLDGGEGAGDSVLARCLGPFAHGDPDHRAQGVKGADVHAGSVPVSRSRNTPVVMGNTFGKHDLESGDLIYRANERLNYRDHSHLPERFPA